MLVAVVVVVDQQTLQQQQLCFKAEEVTEAKKGRSGGRVTVAYIAKAQSAGHKQYRPPQTGLFAFVCL